LSIIYHPLSSIITHYHQKLSSLTILSLGEDDMAFVYDYDALDISIANDVITLPSRCEVKERLAVSFAVAQSTILSIFEARVEKKIEEYKFIPETLANSGKVELSTKQLGVMIGRYNVTTMMLEMMMIVMMIMMMIIIVR